MSLDQLPMLYSKDGLLSAGNKLFMRVFGLPQLIVAQINLRAAGPTSSKTTLQMVEMESVDLRVEEQDVILQLTEIEANHVLIVT